MKKNRILFSLVELVGGLDRGFLIYIYKWRNESFPMREDTYLPFVLICADSASNTFEKLPPLSFLFFSITKISSFSLIFLVKIEKGE